MNEFRRWKGEQLKEKKEHTTFTDEAAAAAGRYSGGSRVVVCGVGDVRYLTVPG